MKVETLVFLPHSEIFEISTLYFYKSEPRMKVETVFFLPRSEIF